MCFTGCFWSEENDSSSANSICSLLRKSTQPKVWRSALCGFPHELLCCHQQHLPRCREDMIILSSTSAMFILNIAPLRVSVKAHQTTPTPLSSGALWENPSPCLSCSCVPLSEEAQAGNWRTNIIGSSAHKLLNYPKWISWIRVFNHVSFKKYLYQSYHK